MKIQLQKTLLGRTLRRLAGEETGAVMMEYVVLAVLLVAAVVGAVIVFGNRISHRLDEAGKSTTGDQATVIDDQARHNAEDEGNAATAYGNQGTISGGNFTPNP